MAATLKRAFWAVLVAATPALILFAPIFVILGGPVGLLLALAAVVVLLAIGLLLSAPALILLRVSGRGNLFAHLCTGALVGALIGSVLLGYMPDSDGSPHQQNYHLQSGGLGAAIGAAYGLWSSGVWYGLVGRRKRSKKLEFAGIQLNDRS